MKEYKIVYRDGEIYKIIDSIYSEDSAYIVLAMVIEAGYEDSRIEEAWPNSYLMKGDISNDISGSN